jgi:hypothetical protein
MMADIEDVYLALDNVRELLERRLPDVAEPGSEPKRRRVTKDDVLASFLAGLTRGGTEHSSVTLKNNAKGETQIEITVRTGESDEIDTAAKAFAEASRLYLQARETFALAGITVSPSPGLDHGRET